MSEPSSSSSNRSSQPGISRRAVLGVGAAAAVGALTYGLWKKSAAKASVFIARNQRYDAGLVKTIRDGLAATGVDAAALRGKRVLLKPNLVEPTKKSPHMTTHPAMVVAAAEVFKDFGAEVIVGEGPGHVRDTELALIESGMDIALRDARLPFADLNYEEVAWRENLGKVSVLPGFFFPKSVAEADFIVSMPKMKTHHWVGFTASMKNLYGTIPGSKYGWPKNVLHHAGIPETVFDINSSLPPVIAIIDGITCMEGDGPIMGSAKQMGLVVISKCPAAADATVARIMGLAPEKVGYLQLADGHLGPIADATIRQRGEVWQSVASPFKILDRDHLQQLRAPRGSRES
jgi:uncharacterized protein (DUF362 family)